MLLKAWALSRNIFKSTRIIEPEICVTQSEGALGHFEFVFEGKKCSFGTMLTRF
jgi:hypothetical protein